jgi:hypothetical protein
MMPMASDITDRSILNHAPPAIEPNFSETKRGLKLFIARRDFHSTYGNV